MKSLKIVENNYNSYGIFKKSLIIPIFLEYQMNLITQNLKATVCSQLGIQQLYALC